MVILGHFGEKKKVVNSFGNNYSRFNISITRELVRGKMVTRCVQYDYSHQMFPATFRNSRDFCVQVQKKIGADSHNTGAKWLQLGSGTNRIQVLGSSKNMELSGAERKYSEPSWKKRCQVEQSGGKLQNSPIKYDITCSAHFGIRLVLYNR